MKKLFTLSVFILNLSFLFSQGTSGSVLFVHADNASSYSGSGTTWSDISGIGNDGTITGATYDATNKVFVFDGSDQVNFPAVLSAGDDTYTIEAYFKPTSATTQVVVEQNTSSSVASRRASMLLISNGTGGFNGQSNDRHNVVNYTLNSWEHWVMVCNVTGSSLKIFRNGSLAYDGTFANAGALNIGDAGLVIGKKLSANGEYFNGEMKFVRIYDRVLTDAEAVDNYNDRDADAMPLTGVLVNPYNYSNYSNTVNISTFPRQYGSRYSKDGSTFLGKAILSTNPNRGSTAAGVVNTSENRLAVYRRMLITQTQYDALNADGEYKTPDEDRSTTGYVSTKYYWTQIGQTLTKDDLPTVQKEGNWRWILNSSAMSADGNTISFGSSDNAQGYGNYNSWKMPAFNWQIAMKYNSTNDTWEKLGQIITTDSVAFNNVTGDFQCIGKDARMSHDGTRMAIGGYGDFASQNVGIIEYDATSNSWSCNYIFWFVKNKTIF